MKALLLAFAGFGALSPMGPAAPAQDKNQLPADITKRLREGKKLELIFLDGSIAKNGVPAFHDYKIVGEPVEVKRAGDRKEIVDALVKDVAAGMGGVKSFRATHGLRVTGDDGKVADILLGDSWLFVFTPDGERQDLRIKNESLKVLNAIKPK